MDASLLEMTNLKIDGLVDEQWQPIVHGVDVRLHRGEVLGLIGESGAGKSTIGLASMGYARTGCRISGGSIRLDGMDLSGAAPGELRTLRGCKVAYVAQSAAASFNPAHRLIDQFVEAPVLHGVMSRAEAEAKAKKLYAELALPDPEHIGERYPHQVSGGQLQRAMVAMAMACDPDLIVFDEPTTALDVTTQIEVLAAIKNAIRLHNTAALYITHDLAVVAQVADRIMVLRYGNKVEEGPTRELLGAAREEYTRRLLGVRKLVKPAAPPIDESRVVLRAEHVTARYRKGPAVLHDVSVNVCRGRTVALVGESGSGKSSLARVVTGLLPPQEGRIVFAGEELPPTLKRRTKEQRRRLQMIYQMPDTAVNPRHKVKEIIGRPVAFYFGRSPKEIAARVDELLDRIRLPIAYRERYPAELSGGEKQRVCIARALAAEPEVILCDEVTSALDQLVAEGVLKLLQELQDELDVSYLFITHDLATVKAVADDIVVMQNGRVVEQGPRDELLAPPHEPYTELLLSSVPEMDPDWLEGVLERRAAGS